MLNNTLGWSCFVVFWFVSVLFLLFHLFLIWTYVLEDVRSRCCFVGLPQSISCHAMNDAIICEQNKQINDHTL